PFPDARISPRSSSTRRASRSIRSRSRPASEAFGDSTPRFAARTHARRHSCGVSPGSDLPPSRMQIAMASGSPIARRTTGTPCWRFSARARRPASNRSPSRAIGARLRSTAAAVRSESRASAPAQLVSPPHEQTGIVRARAETIRPLARRVVDETIAFDSRFDAEATIAALKTIPGIGDWTAEYIAMRALGEPDAFPRGDLVLRRMAGDCTARALERRSQSWRPWRAYAVMLLWQAAGDARHKPSRSTHAQAERRPKLHD